MAQDISNTHAADDMFAQGHPSMKRLVQSAAQLYSLPDVYIRVRNIIRDPNSSLGELSQVLANDPGLSTRLLRMANSVFFGIPSKVDTISRAVQVIGFQHIYNMVIGTSITKAFQGISNEIMSLETFWVASAERALVCRLLAQQAQIKDTERLFICGLILDIGHLVIYKHLPDQARQAIERSQSHLKPLHLVEQEVIGFDAAALGAALANEWNFPQSLCELIEYQNSPESAKDDPLGVAIAYAAKQLAGVPPEQEAIESILMAMPGEVKTMLKLSLDNCLEILKQSAVDLHETLAFIMPGAAK